MIRSGQTKRIPRLRLERVQGLTDAVVAVAITLLVLNIEIPAHHNFSQDGLLKFLVRIRHDVVIYAASFFLIATYWMEHHAMFHYFEFGSRTLAWLNFLFLFTVTMVPFATRLKGLYKDEFIVLAVFGAIHIACWLTLLVLWRYGSTRTALLRRPMLAAERHVIARGLLVGPSIIVIAIAVSYVNMELGTYLFLSVPLFFLSQRRIDGNWDVEVEPASR